MLLSSASALCDCCCCGDFGSRNGSGFANHGPAGCDLYYCAEISVEIRYHTLVQEMRASDPEAHQRYFRMSVGDFDELLEKVRNKIEKAYTQNGNRNCNAWSQHNTYGLW